MSDESVDSAIILEKVLTTHRLDTSMHTTQIAAPAQDTYASARFNMIEQQIRTWEVLDARVLDLLMQIPREAFVPKEYLGLAFADIEVPLGFGQTMLAPKVQGRILQSLHLQPSDSVLEIGTGSGYLTALMAKMAKQVVSVEIQPELSARAARHLDAQGIDNVTLLVGDAANGWADLAPYDVIVYTAALPLMPQAALQQLAPAGRLFVMLGEAPVMQATMVRQVAAGSFKRDVLFETCIPQLQNAPQPERFTF